MAFEAIVRGVRSYRAASVKVTARRWSRLATSRAAAEESKISTPRELRIAEWTGSPSQLRALSALNAKLNASPFSVEPETAQWFLRDRDYDPVEAEEKLISTAKWRKSIDWENLSPEQIREEMATGKVRLHEHPDILGRPVIVLDTSKHRAGDFPVESTQKLCAYAVKQALQKLPPDGDTFITIYDLRKFGPANADLKFVKYMIDLFFVYHPKRLGQSLLVEAPWVFQPVWQFVKPLLRKYSALVRFVDAKEVREEYFTEETLPNEFRI